MLEMVVDKKREQRLVSRDFLRACFIAAGRKQTTIIIVFSVYLLYLNHKAVAF